MCGIAGFVGQGNEGILKKMTQSLRHRGPDDIGFYCDVRIGLGHRRLSVIDLKTGHQPIINEYGNVIAVTNGEIYNFSALRNELQNNGHKFRTKSDAEVIVHLYENLGIEFVNKLNGMFSIALWDKNKKKLVLCRDRLGQKPLYWSDSGNNLIFGSEMKALLQHPSVKKEMDFFSLAKYLIYEYIPAPWTIFRNIYKLGPGQRLVYQNGKINIENYWDISFNKYITSSKEEILKELDSKLEESVKKRLVSDVPIGVFLSGGIDSTMISYYAARLNNTKIKTFSIGFKDRSFDESEYAHMAARCLDTDHYHQMFTPKDLLELIPQIAEIIDEPFADASIVPTFLLSKFTKEKVTVALGGDGGDELFAGYPTFQAYKTDKLYQMLPFFLRDKVIKRAVDLLPVSFENISLDFKLKRFVSGQKYSPLKRNQIWLGSFAPEQLAKLLQKNVKADFGERGVFEDIDQYLRGIPHEDSCNKLIYLYLKQYLQDDILNKTDRASMHVALEVRAPFLDHELVEFVNSIPFKYKLNGFTTKYLLKELMKDKLPPEIVYRPKKGFGIPIAKWVRKELKDFMLSLLSSPKIQQQGIFNEKYVSQLISEHLSGRKDNRKLLWTLMAFEMWHERWA